MGWVYFTWSLLFRWDTRILTFVWFETFLKINMETLMHLARGTRRQSSNFNRKCCLKSRGQAHSASKSIVPPLFVGAVFRKAWMDD